MSNAPVSVLISIMYRDGGNNKFADNFTISNDNKLPESVVMDVIEKVCGEEIIPMQWGLPSMSPISHPDEECSPDDHCYNEIEVIKMLSKDDENNDFYQSADVDVQDIADALEKGGTKEWFECDNSIREEKVSIAKRALEGEGYTLLSKNEKSDLDARTLPFGVDRDLLLKVASIGLTNNNLIEFCEKEGVAEHKELAALQSAILNNLTR